MIHLRENNDNDDNVDDNVDVNVEIRRIAALDLAYDASPCIVLTPEGVVTAEFSKQQKDFKLSSVDREGDLRTHLPIMEEYIEDWYPGKERTRGIFVRGSGDYCEGVKTDLVDGAVLWSDKLVDSESNAMVIVEDGGAGGGEGERCEGGGYVQRIPQDCEKEEAEEIGMLLSTAFLAARLKPRHRRTVGIQ